MCPAANKHKTAPYIKERRPAMLSYLFFWTRFYLLNFDTMWALPALAFVLLLALRLLMGGKQPCKGLLFIMPALYVVLGFVNAWLCVADNIALVGLMSVLGSLEVILIFGWLGLLLGMVIDTLIQRAKGAAHA